MVRRRLLPKPPEPPEGMMLFYRREVPIEHAENYARQVMSGFDDLPPRTRFAVNCAPVWPHAAEKLVARHGDAGAAQNIFRTHSDHIFKTRDRTGAHP